MKTNRTKKQREKLRLLKKTVKYTRKHHWTQIINLRSRFQRDSLLVRFVFGFSLSSLLFFPSFVVPAIYWSLVSYSSTWICSLCFLWNSVCRFEWSLHKQAILIRIESIIFFFFSNREKILLLRKIKSHMHIYRVFYAFVCKQIKTRSRDHKWFYSWIFLHRFQASQIFHWCARWQLENNMSVCTFEQAKNIEIILSSITILFLSSE